MANRRIEQADLDELSAFLDNELDSEATARINQRLRTEPDLAQCLAELQALDKALDQVRIPHPPQDLSQQIITNVTGCLSGGRRLGWTAGLGIAAAAAAAIVIVAIVQFGSTGSARSPQSHGNQGDNVVLSGKQEELLVENLDFYRDMDVIENYETLEAIERMEAADTGA